MGVLTEVEIFDCMIDNLKKAVAHAKELATKPRKGVAYMALRDELKLIEGACRQAAAFRADARWYPLGMMMEHVHKVAGEWLRGVIDPQSGRRRPIPEGVKHPLFSKLAENLEALLTNVRMLKDGATKRTGPILPVMLEGPHRQTRDNYGVRLPDGMVRRGSGLIVPSDIAA